MAGNIDDYSDILYTLFIIFGQNEDNLHAAH